MKPMTVTVIILAVIISYSLLFFAEASGRHVSNAVNFILNIPDDVFRLITQSNVPKMTIDRTVVEEGTTDMTIYIYMNSMSTKVETVLIEIIPNPKLFETKVEKRVISPGANSPSVFIDDVSGSGNFEIEINLKTRDGELITSSKIYRSFNVVPDISKSILIACDSSKYCRDMGLGMYCWGNTDGKYECHDSCGAILTYAPNAENCCLNLCSAVLRNGRCDCKT